MVSIFISGLISALIVWVCQYIPFLNITLDGIVPILLVAIVIGLVCAFVVPAVKGLFKNANAVIYLIISLIINALVLMLAAWIVPGFGITFWSAVIVAAILSLFVAGFSLTGGKK